MQYMLTINTIEVMLKTFKVQVSLRDEEDKFNKSNIYFLTVPPCWLAGIEVQVRNRQRTYIY